MQKIFYSLLILFGFSANGFSQYAPVEVKSSKPVFTTDDSGPLLRVNGPQDTLDDYATRATGFTIYGAGITGYIFGTCSDGFGGPLTEATAVHFDSVGDVDVIGVYAWVAEKKIMGPADVFKFELFDAGIDSMPVNLLAYGNLNMAFVDTNVQVNFATLLGLQVCYLNQGTAHINEDFLISMNYTGVDDSIGLVSSVQGDGLGEKRCRQLSGPLLGSAWTRLGELWTVMGNPLDADPIFYPIVEHGAADIFDPFYSTNFNLFPVSPNPVEGDPIIRLDVKSTSIIRLYVFDEGGKFVFDTGLNSMNPGQYNYKLEKANLAAGTYFYTVLADKGSPVTSRFVVQK